MPEHPDDSSEHGWWFQRAEELLGSLTGVVSAKIVPAPTGGVDTIHMLTTDEVSPKQTVRNVESALQARFNVKVDHRKISVAQTSAASLRRDREPDAAAMSPPELRAVLSTTDAPSERAPLERVPSPFQPTTERSAASMTPARSPSEKRVLFVGHSTESIRSQQVTLRVALDWEGERFVGEASGTDSPRARLEGFANATLRALEAILKKEAGERAAAGVAMSLDGVKVLDAFERRFVLVAVSALFDRRMSVLTGAGPVQDSLDRAVILATLQAADRRVRAFLEGIEVLPPTPPSVLESSPADPFEVWG